MLSPYTPEPVPGALSAILSPERLLPTAMERRVNTDDAEAYVARIGKKAGAKTTTPNRNSRLWQRVKASRPKRAKAATPHAEAQPMPPRKPRVRKAKPPAMPSKLAMRQAAIVEAWKTGNFPTLTAIAEHIGCYKGVVQRALRQHREFLSHGDAARVPYLQELARRPEGCITLQEAGEMLGVAKNTVRDRVKKAGVEPVRKTPQMSWYSLADLRAKGIVA